MIHVDNIFTFSDITYDNPLHNSVRGARYRIYTDGTHISYKHGHYFQKTLCIMASTGNWSVSEIQERLLFMGHIWAPSISFPLDEIVNVEKPKEK